MNLLLDTSVFIDYVGKKPPFYEEAEQVIAAGYFGDAALWVPAQSLKDAFYVLRKYLPSDRIQQVMSATLEIVTPVDLTAYDIRRALELRWQDYEDCLVAISAEKVKADYLVTRDSKGFQRSMVPVISPTELMTQVFAEKEIFYGSEVF